MHSAAAKRQLHQQDRERGAVKATDTSTNISLKLLKDRAQHPSAPLNANNTKYPPTFCATSVLRAPSTPHRAASRHTAPPLVTSRHFSHHFTTRTAQRAGMHTVAATTDRQWIVDSSSGHQPIRQAQSAGCSDPSCPAADVRLNHRSAYRWQQRRPLHARVVEDISGIHVANTSNTQRKW